MNTNTHNYIVHVPATLFIDFHNKLISSLPPDDQYEVLSDLPEDAVVFYCRVCQERRDRGKGEGGEGGEGEGGEGVVATWRYAVNKFMREAFMKVSSVCMCVRVVLVDEVSCTINNTYSHYFCAQVHVCVCVHACMYEHKHTLHVHVYMYACTIKTKMYMYIYTCIHVHVPVHAGMNTNCACIHNFVHLFSH